MCRKYRVRIKQSTWAEEMMDIVLWSDLWKPFLYLILKNTKTFVQPVGQPVEDDSVHPRGGDSQRVTPHVGLVVDVVLKDVDLKRKRRWWRWCFPLWWHFIFCIKAAGFISSRSDACVYPPASISVLIFAFSPLFFISSSVLNIHELHSNCTCSTSALWTCCIPRGIMRQMKYLSYVHPALEHRLFISMSESIIQSEMDAKKCCGPNKVLAPHVSANRPPGWGSLSVQDVCVQTPKTLISFVLFSTWAEDKWLNLCEHRTL